MGTYKGIQGFSVQSLASDPAADGTATGQLWYNSASNVWKVGTEVTAGAWATATVYPLGIRETLGSSGTQTAALGYMGYSGDPPAPGYINESYEYDGTSWAGAVSMNRNTGAYLQGFGSQTAAASGGFYTNVGATVLNTCEEYNGVGWTTVNNCVNALGLRTGSGTQTAGLEGGGTAVNPTPPVGNTETYDGTTWTEVNDLNTPRRQAGQHNGTSTACFCIGGSPGVPDASHTVFVEQWNGTSWSETTDVNTSRTSAGASGTTALALYYGGQTGPSTGVAVTESWNGTSWTEVGDMSVARGRGGSGGTTNTSAIYFAGGVGAFLDNVEEWNSPFYGLETVTTS